MKHLADSQKLRTIGLVIAGNATYSLAVVMFILPCGLISGGTTGLALIGQHFWGIPVSSFVLVSNIIMFCLGALIMGRWFAFNTALSTFCYPIFLHLFGCIPGIDSMTKDPMLAVGWSCDGKYLAACGNDRTVRVWQPERSVRIPAHVSSAQTHPPTSWKFAVRPCWLAHTATTSNVSHGILVTRSCFARVAAKT